MSTSQNNDIKVGAAQPKTPPAPDGKSPLPDFPPDFPTPTTGGGGDSGPSSGSVPK